MHIEIIKRSDTILKFLAKQQALKNEYLDLMWAASQGKHEAITRTIYDTIIAIAGYFSNESREKLFSKIKKIPLSDYTEITIDLIKRFALSIFQKEDRIMIDSDDEDYEDYG